MFENFENLLISQECDCFPVQFGGFIFILLYETLPDECEVSWTAGQKKIILKQEQMIAFYKYLYAGGSAPRTPYKYQRYIPEMGKPAKCVQLSSCQLTSHLSLPTSFLIL